VQKAVDEEGGCHEVEEEAVVMRLRRRQSSRG